MEDIHKQIDELAELIKSRPCYEEIKKQEKLMEENPEVINLAMKYSSAQSDYSDGLNHYEEGSPELKKLYKSLLICKNNLDSHPLVLKYYELLGEVNEPLNYLTFNLLSLFKIKGKHTCR